MMSTFHAAGSARAITLVTALVLAACGTSDRQGFSGEDAAAGPSPSPAGSFDGGIERLDGGGCVGGLPPTVAADLVIDPAFAKDYVAYDLGLVPGMPKYKYGGITLDALDRDTLLVGGSANEPSGSIYAVRVVRSACRHIIGFSGSAWKRADAPYIDGGLTYGPGDVLMYAAWPLDADVRQRTSGMVGFLPPGATRPSKTIEGARHAMPEALAALGFVPPGFPGAGKLKLVTWEGGSFYDAELTKDGNGRASDIPSVTSRGTLPGGPEGFAYVPIGSAGFSKASMLVSEWSGKAVAAYDVTSDGDPALGTRRTLLTGLAGAEGAFFDPETGDFLFSTWNLDRPERLIVVSGFAAPAPR